MAPSRSRRLRDLLQSRLSQSTAARRRRKIAATGHSGETLEERALLTAAPFEDGSILVGGQDGVTTEDLESVLGGVEVRALGDYGVFHVILPGGVEVESAISTYEESSLVSYAQPNLIYHPAAAPDDARFDEMYHLHNTGQTGGTPDNDIDAVEAWDITTDASSVVVAIIDSGTDIDHEDLAANIWTNPGETPGDGIDNDGNGYIDDVNGWNFFDGTNDPRDTEPGSHGTHVGGTVGAVGNNAIGVTGVAQTVQLMPLRIFAPSTSTAVILEAINYSVDMGASVSNNSWGGGGFDQALYDAIDNARANDQLFVAAAGNHGGDNDTGPFYPATYDLPNIVSVAATDHNDRLAGFSAFGATTVDLAAPGVNILSTYENDTYGLNSGTSMATPVVSGAAAILRAADPSMNFQEIKDLLMNSVDVKPGLTGRVLSNGRLNLRNTLSPVQLTVFANQVREDAGANATFGRLRRQGDTSLPMVVELSSSDTTELTVPSIVTIDAGDSQAFFPITAVDDNLLDGTQTVGVVASIGGVPADNKFIDVLDVESLSLSISPSDINEDDGPNAAVGTITRSNDDGDPPNIFVSSGNEVFEYDLAGAPVGSFAIDYPGGTRPGGEDARDLVVTASGDLVVYNGDGNAFLSQFDGTDWTHRTIPGLSANTAFASAGGIATSNNFVFSSDMNTPTGPESGIVRTNITTGSSFRFADSVPGGRLFGTMSSQTNDDLVEIDPETGVVINSFPAPYGRGDSDGLAYDGSSLWYLGTTTVGPAGLDDLWQLDAETGAVVDQHDIGLDTGFNGLAALDGKIYLLDSSAENDIVVWDPINQFIVSILDIDGLNGVTISGGLTAAVGPDRLYVTDALSQRVYEIDPVSGAVTGSFDQMLGADDSGLAAVGQELFVVTDSSATIEVYDRTGVFQRSISVAEATGFGSLGGDGVDGPVSNNRDFIDVAVSLDDGVIYGLDSAGLVVQAFDPQTLQYVSEITLDRAVSAIAVDAFGEIFGAVGDVIHQFDAGGLSVASQSTGAGNIIDLDVSVNGALLAGTLSGSVVLTDTAFSAPALSFVGGPTAAFVSFSSAPGSATGDLLITIDNDDPSEASAPQTVILPAGDQSVSFPIDAVDDAIIDGTQVVTLTPVAPGYTEQLSDTLRVHDVENIFVDIDETDILETDGENAATINVSRSNVEGPFDFESTLAASNDTDLTILDTDTVISVVEIPPQFARVSDINVTISLEHGHIGDLDVFLLSPAGTRVELFTDIGGIANVIDELVLDDQAASPVTTGSSPFTGHFQPEEALSALNGERADGTWTLEITDDTHQSSGTLLYWGIEVGALGFAPLDVTLNTNDPTEAVPQSTTVTIPANQVEVELPLDAIDDDILDGTQDVTITGSNGSYVSGSDMVAVGDAEFIRITFDREEISEAAGPNAAVGTVTRSNGSDLGSALVVNLENKDPSEISIPATVTIPAGQQSATFQVDAVDDNRLDGRKKVRVNASAAGYKATTDSRAFIFVTDSEPILHVQLGVAEVFENQQFVSGTLSRTNYASLSTSLSVALTSDHASLTVPPSVTIPVGQESVDFTVTLMDNDILDGDRDVTITASSGGTFPGTTVLTVKDHETVSLSFDPDEFHEARGSNASTGTITRNNTDIGSALVVNLVNGDSSEISTPESVTIPAGESSVDFTIAAVNDPEFDGPQTVTIEAIAAGYVEETADLTVLDHEPTLVTGPLGIVNDPRPTITFDPVEGATRYQIKIQNVSTGETNFVNDDTLPADATSYTLTRPMGIGNYDVFVRYFDALERPQPFSRSLRVKVRTAPKFTSPDSLTNNGDIAWNAVIDAEHYELKVNDLSRGKDGVVDEKGLVNSSFEADLEPGIYEAFVRAIGPNGIRGERSEIRFTVLLAPTFTNLVSGSYWQQNVTARWEGSEGADHYDFRVHDLTIGLDNGGRNIVRDRFVVGTEYTPELEFEVGHVYAISVSAVSAEGENSVWSERIRYSVGARPNFLSPADGSTTESSVVFRWDEVFGSKKYDFRLRQVGKRGNIYRVRNVQGNAHSPDIALESGKRYRAFVRSVSQLGQKTRWARVEFTVASSDTKDVVSPGDIGPATVQASETLVAQDATPDSGFASEPVIINSYVVDTPEAPQEVKFGPDPVDAPTVSTESAGEIDSIMQQLPALAPEWWAVGRGAPDFALEADADTLGSDVTPTSLAAAAVLGLAVATTKNRKDEEKLDVQ